MLPGPSNWQGWTPYGECTTTCGPGTHTSTNTCIRDSACPGDPCDGDTDGDDIESHTKDCGNECCEGRPHIQSS